MIFESAGVKQDLCSQDICNVGGVDCWVLNHAKRASQVQIHHYPSFSIWGGETHTFPTLDYIPEIRTGTILLDVILNHHIPRTLQVGTLRVKVWYRDQPLSCDICHGPHRVSDCDLRGKCRRCGEGGHFARACPRPRTRTGDAVTHASDGAVPAAAEAAGCAGC